MFDSSPRAPLREGGSSMKDEVAALRVARQPRPPSSTKLEPPPGGGSGEPWG
jgi:hypothetical protein